MTPLFRWRTLGSSSTFSACETASQAKGGAMTEYRKVTREELDQLAHEELPERAAMSLINANVAVPVNAAVAANVLSDQSVASADATQDSTIRQTNLG
jgi:hypothetical protein